MRDSNPPPLPAHVSADGHEVWDWAAKFSAHTQREHRKRELRQDIAAIGTRCGDCDKWMKSRECPKEHNVNGQTRGPSSMDMKCGQFVESRAATGRRDSLRAKLASESPA